MNENLEFGTFQEFPKIIRYLNTEFTITEKIDGTNACLAFEWDGTLTTQSRKRIITPEDDNYGFAHWAQTNRNILFEFFGTGRHFGEWWGRGIQKRYGQFVEGKYFTPFNVGRFNDTIPDWPEGTRPLTVLRCGLPFSALDNAVANVQYELQTNGSPSVPGATPEGIMIWSQTTGYIKYPFDDGHKWIRQSSSEVRS